MFAKRVYVQGGPLPVMNWVITPVSSVISQLAVYKAIYRGYKSIYNW